MPETPALRVSDERLAWLVREMGGLPEPHDPFDDELLVCLRELQTLRREREWRPISEWPAMPEDRVSNEALIFLAYPETNSGRVLLADQQGPNAKLGLSAEWRTNSRKLKPDEVERITHFAFLDDLLPRVPAAPHA